MTTLLAEPQLHAQAASGVQSAAWLLIAFPLVGGAILLLGGRRTDKWGHLLGVAMSLASFVVGVAAFAQMLGQPGSGRTRLVHLFQWISIGSFRADVNVLIDPLSISFVLLITGVGS